MAFYLEGRILVVHIKVVGFPGLHVTCEPLGRHLVVHYHEQRPDQVPQREFVVLPELDIPARPRREVERGKAEPNEVALANF